MATIKKLTWILFTSFLSLSMFAQKIMITGKVSEPDGMEIIGASVLVKGTTTATITDIDGKYNISANTGDILIFSFLGFKTKDIKVDSAVINVFLEEEVMMLEECVVVGYGTTARRDITGSAARTKGKTADIRIRGSKSSSSRYEKTMEDRKMPEKSEYTSEPAGQLTCGEWNDLDNWKSFQKLWQNHEFNEMRKNRGFNPENRYAVEIKDDNFKPYAGATVELLDDDKVIWKAISDNKGKAELWANTNKEEAKTDNHTIRVTANGNTQTVKAFSYHKVNSFRIKAGSQKNREADVLMVVDATGSMGDELHFIKSELNNVLERVKAKQTDLSIRTGAVYYRDHGDEFVTKMSPFTDDVNYTLNFIGKQRADGGGDFPEAVDSALHDAIYKLRWNEKAVARLLFLVLDAPPHINKNVNENLHRQIKDAAAMGITIIPVVASGIDKESEFLFRTWAAYTNGTYVFLTDHSGIGNTHLKASVDDYKVELLNDALVRLITKYTEF